MIGELFAGIALAAAGVLQTRPAALQGLAWAEIALRTRAGMAVSLRDNNVFGIPLSVVIWGRV
jgi:hypothetical protein